jgi:hypothetical protein
MRTNAIMKQSYLAEPMRELRPDDLSLTHLAAAQHDIAALQQNSQLERITAIHFPDSGACDRL